MTTLVPLNIVAVALLGGAFAIAANMLSFVMIDKINQRVTEPERLSYFRWGTEVQKRYKELYPTSKLPLIVNICIAMMLVVFAWVVRFWVFGSDPARK